MADSSGQGQVVVPSATPTVGSILGAIVSTAVVTKTGADPIAAGAIATGITGFMTWLFHFVHQKLGTPE